MNTSARGIFPLVPVLLLAVPLTVLAGMFSARAQVGVTSATDGDPLGKPPAQPERVLRIGIDVHANELITTGANDRAHLVFLDGTSVTVGSNARLTIDKFVYDPNDKRGEISISATKGVFRVVGGKISKTTPISINTPSASMGVRGGIAIITIEDAKTISNFIFGIEMTVVSAGQTQSMTRPGSQITTFLGQPPSIPGLIAKGGLVGPMAQLEGTSNKPGNGPHINANAANQGAQSLAQNNSAQGPSSTSSSVTNAIANAQNIATNAVSNAQVLNQAPQGQSQSTGQQPPVPGAPIGTSGRMIAQPSYIGFNNQTLAVAPIPQNNKQLAQTSSVKNGLATISLADNSQSFTLPWLPGGELFAVSITDPTRGTLTGTGFVSANGDFFYYSLADQNARPLTIAGGTPTGLAQFPTSGIAAYNLTNIANPGQLPFAGGSVATDPQLSSAASKSPLYSIYSPNIAPSVGGPAPGAQGANALQATISIVGQGASQKSYVGVFIADYFKDYNNNTIGSFGSYNASYRQSASAPIGRQTSAESTFDTGAGNSIFGSNASAMVYTTDASTTTVSSSGGVVTSTTTTRTPQASFDQPYNALSGSGYTTVTAATSTATPAGVGTNRTSQTLNGYVGGLVDQRDVSGNFSTRAIGAAGAQPTDVVLTTDASTNRAEATITVRQWDGSTATATFKLGGTSGPRAATSSFIDDTLYALRDRPAGVLSNTTSITSSAGTSTGADVISNTFIVSSGAAPAPGLFQAAGVTPCTCEFLTWGWWNGDVAYSANSVHNPGGRDRLNLATYVAGTLTGVADLSALNMMGATATYSGAMVGNVQNGGSSYIAAGSYTNQWSFGSRSGIASISFDGATYGGGLTANTVMNGGGPTFSTASPLASTNVNGRSLTLSGSFFSSPSVPAAAQAGSFAITGSSYTAGGTFAAGKK